MSGMRKRGESREEALANVDIVERVMSDVSMVE